MDPRIELFRIVLRRDEDRCGGSSGTCKEEFCPELLKAGDARPGVPPVERIDMAEAARCALGAWRTVRLLYEDNDIRAVWREEDRKPGLNSSMSSKVTASASSQASLLSRRSRYDNALNQVS
jgi:hypothetical protein